MLKSLLPDPPHVLGRPVGPTGAASTMAEKEGAEPLAGSRLHVLHVLPGASQIPHRLALGLRHPDRRQLAGPMEPGQGGGIPPIVLDPISRAARHLRGGGQQALGTQRAQEPVGLVTTWTRLASGAGSGRSYIGRCKHMRIQG